MANDLAQHIDYPELHNISSYSEQHAEYSEQYANFSEQYALWFLYKISSSAACSFGVSIDCTSTTSWIDFFIAIGLLILVMIKTNGKMSKKKEQANKKWCNTSKDPGLGGPLGGLCNILFPKKYNKKVHVSSFFFTTEWDIK